MLDACDAAGNLYAMLQLDLTPHWNRRGLATRKGGDADGCGFAYDVRQLDAPVEVRGVRFTLGPTHGSAFNVVSADGQSIEVPPAAASELEPGASLYLLCAGVCGGQQLALRVHYANGTESTVTVEIEDWCRPAGSVQALAFDHRLGPSGEVDPTPCFIYAVEVALDGVPTRIELGSAPGFNLFAATLASAGQMRDAAPTTGDAFAFFVHVVSGSKTGATFYGEVSVEGCSPETDGPVRATSVRFDYDGRSLGVRSFDGPVHLRFERGVPVELIGVGGAQTARFGFSAGFDRAQFGRNVEAFIAQGHPYFGYLDERTYVDGAGIVRFGRA